jgi:predicted RNase H-like HicB family nuclease
MPTTVRKTSAGTSTAFRVTVRPNGDAPGYWAKCDMPGGGCATQGDTLQEIQKNMLEAAELYMEDYPDVLNYYLVFEVSDA